jgi:hypothetical protein
MSRPDDGTWYELRPNGHLSLAVMNPKRYADRESATAAATAMRERSPDFKFVEIISYESTNGERSRARPVARV